MDTGGIAILYILTTILLFSLGKSMMRFEKEKHNEDTIAL